MKKNIFYLSICCLMIIPDGCKSKSAGGIENTEEPDISANTVIGSSEYFMQTTFEQTISAGKKTEMKFIPKKLSDTAISVDLQLLHDKKMHVIIVNTELSLFYHLHPQLNDSGEYLLPFTFNYGGKYVLFVDYAPQNAAQQVERFPLSIMGMEPEQRKYSTERLSAKTGDFDVSLLPSKLNMETNESLTFEAIMMLDGKEIQANALDNYLGAKAHMVIISADTKQYLHVHPDVQENRLQLYTTFPIPGIYRGWLQFQYQGVVMTADFEFFVKPGKNLPQDLNKEI